MGEGISRSGDGREAGCGFLVDVMVDEDVRVVVITGERTIEPGVLSTSGFVGEWIV